MTSHIPAPASQLSAFDMSLFLQIYNTWFQFDFTTISRDTSHENTEIEGIRMETYLKGAYHVVHDYTEWHN